MNQIPDDELIGAYLDGELSEADVARVEALLTEQPELRQLLEELRTMRGGFEALPRHRLDEHFVERVMRSAEREMLAGDPPQVRLEHVEGEPIEMKLASVERSHHEQEARVAPASRDLWRRFRRPLAWAGAALAAGLLLMIFERGPQAPAPMAPVAEAPREPLPKDAEFRAPAEAPASAPEALGEKESGAADDGKDRERLRYGKAAERPLTEQSPEMPRSAAGALAGNAREAAPKSATAAKSPAKPEAAGRMKAAFKEADSKSGLERESFEHRFQNEGLRAGAALAYDVERLEDGKVVSEPLDEKTLIVWCDVDRDVADRPEFRQLLASNGIAWQPDNRRGEPTGGFGFGSRESKAKSPAPGKAAVEEEQAEERKQSFRQKSEKSESSAVPQRTDLSQTELSADSGQAGSGPAASRTLQRAQVVSEALDRPDSDYVLLEATGQQIDAVLAEIDRRPELFLSVNVEPASEAPEQRAYSAYNRGRELNSEFRDQLAKRRETDSKPPQRSAKLAIVQQEKSQVAQGRAQRVIVMPQNVDALDAVDSDDAKKSPLGSTRSGQAPPERMRTAGADRRNAADKEDAEKDAADKKGAVAAQKPAEKAELGDKRLADEAEEVQGYQQALFIFRRVSPAAAAAAPTASEPPAKSEPSAKPAK